MGSINLKSSFNESNNKFSQSVFTIHMQALKVKSNKGFEVDDRKIVNKIG